MIVKRMILPGRFVQAHPYFDTLWLTRMDGSLQAFDTERYASERLNGSGSVAVAAFARNDRLRSDRGKTHLDLQTPDMRSFLLSDRAVEVSAEDLERYSYPFTRDPRLEEAIDLRFYSGRAYAATDAGMVHFRALGRHQLDELPIRASRRAPDLDRCFEAMPLQIQTRLGTVNASCGEDGGWYTIGANSPMDSGWKPMMRNFADLSFGSEFAGAGVANIKGPTDLQPLPAHKVQAPMRSRQGGEDREQVEITDIDRDADPIAVKRLDAALNSPERKGARPLQVFATTRRVFVPLSDGEMLQFPIAEKDRFAHGTPRPLRHEGPGSRILSMTTAAGQIIAECRADVRLFSNRRWTTLFDGPTFSVRGYPNSKWYRNLVTIVATDHVQLVLLIDDA